MIINLMMVRMRMTMMSDDTIKVMHKLTNELEIKI